MSDAKEVPERHIDARCLVPVVVDAKSEKPGPGILVVSNRYPDVVDDTGSRQVSEYNRFSRDRMFAVIVAVRVKSVAG
jgi:hypothetical protein